MQQLVCVVCLSRLSAGPLTVDYDAQHVPIVTYINYYPKRVKLL
jgi:hypothetical protein